MDIEERSRIALEMLEEKDSMLKVKDQEISQLSSRLTQVTKALEQLSTDHAQEQDSFRDLVNSWEAERDGLIRSEQILQSTLDQERDEWKIERAKLVQALVPLKEQNEALLAEHAPLREQVETLIEALDTCRHDRDALEEALKSGWTAPKPIIPPALSESPPEPRPQPPRPTDEDRIQMQRRLDASLAECERLKHRLADVEKDANEKETTQIATRDELAQVAQSQEEALGRLMKERDALDEERKRLTTLLRQRNESLSLVQKDLAAATTKQVEEKEEEALQLRLERRDAEIARLRVRLNKADEALERAKTTINRGEDRIRQLESRLTDHDRNHSAEMERQRRAVARLESRLTDARKAEEKAQQEAKDAQTAMRKAIKRGGSPPPQPSPTPPPPSSSVQQLQATIDEQENALSTLSQKVVRIEHARLEEQHKHEEEVWNTNDRMKALERQLHVQAEDGTVKIRHLEESLRVQSGKSDAHREVSKSLEEIGKLRLECNRERRDAQYSREQLRILKSELQGKTIRISQLEHRLLDALAGVPYGVGSEAVGDLVGRRSDPIRQAIRGATSLPPKEEAASKDVPSELSYLRTRLADTLVQLSAAQESQSARSVEIAAAATKEIAGLRAQMHSAQQSLDAMREAEAEHQRHFTQLEERVLESTSAASKAHRDAEEAKTSAQSRLREASERVVSSEAETTRLERMLEERSEQLSVLLATVEAVEQRGDLESRVATLSVMLSDCKAMEGSARRRLDESHRHIEREVRRRVVVEGELENVRISCSRLESRLASSESTVAMLRGELSSAEKELAARETDLEAALLSPMGDDCITLTANLSAAQRQMEIAAERHAQELIDARAEAGTIAQQATLHCITGEEAPLIKAVQSLADVMSATNTKVDKKRITSQEADRLRKVLLDQSGLIAKLTTDRQRFAWDAERAWATVGTLENRVQMLARRWEACSLAREAERTLTRRQANALVERARRTLTRSSHRSKALCGEIDSVNAKLLASQSEATRLKLEVEASRALVESLQYDMARVENDCALEIVQARSQAEQEGRKHEQEMFGEVGSLRAYFDGEVLPLLLPSDPQEKIVGLSRELVARRAAEADLLQHLDSMQRRCSEIAARNASLSGVVKEHQNHWLSAQSQISSALEQLNRHAADIHPRVSRFDENAAVQESLDAAQAEMECAALKQEVDQLQSTIDQLKSERAELIDECAKKIERQEEQHARAREDAIASLKAQNAKQENLRPLESRIESNVQQLRDQLEEERAVRFSLEETMTTCVDDSSAKALIAAAQRKAKAALEAEAEVRRQLAARDERIAMLQKGISTPEPAAPDQAATINRLRLLVAELEADKAKKTEPRLTASQPGTLVLQQRLEEAATREAALREALARARDDHERAVSDASKNIRLLTDAMSTLADRVTTQPVSVARPPENHSFVLASHQLVESQPSPNDSVHILSMQSMLQASEERAAHLARELDAALEAVRVSERTQIALQTLEAALDAREASELSAREERDRLELIVAELESQHAHAGASLEGLTKDAAAALVRTRSLEEEVSRLSNERDACIEKETAVRRESNERVAKLEDLLRSARLKANESSAETDTRVHAAEAEAEKARAESKSAQSQLAQVQEELDGVRQALDRRSAHIQKQTRQKLIQEGKLSEGRLQSELTRVRQAYEHSCAEASKACKELREERKHWESEYRRLAGECNAAVKEGKRTSNVAKAQIELMESKFSAALSKTIGEKSALSSQIVKENAGLITQLASKDAELSTLRSKSPRKKEKQASAEGDDDMDCDPGTALSVGLLTAKVARMHQALRLTQLQLSSAQHEAAEARQEAEGLGATERESRRKAKSLSVEIADAKRSWSNLEARLRNEIDRLKETWHSPADWAELQEKLKKEKVNAHMAKEEANRRKRALAAAATSSVASSVDEPQPRDDAVRKLKNELSRKDGLLGELRARLKEEKIAREEVDAAKTGLEMKIRSLTVELGRKESIAREARNRADALRTEVQLLNEDATAGKEVRDDIERRLKKETSRRESQLKVIRAKLAKAEEALAEVEASRSRDRSDAEQQLLHSEDHLRRLKDEYEEKISNWRTTIQRLGVWCLESLAGSAKSQKTVAMAPDAAQAALSILEMTPDELSDICSVTKRGEVDPNDLQRLQDALMGLDVDGSCVVAMLTGWIEERVDLEKADVKEVVVEREIVKQVPSSEPVSEARSAISDWEMDVGAELDELRERLNAGQGEVDDLLVKGDIVP